MTGVVAALRAAGCVFAEDEARILLDTATTPDELDAMLRRRLAGEPLEHVVGWAEFYGLRIVVRSGVFVPRRRSELVVRVAVARIAQCRAPIVVDLCCGSGAIGAAIAAAVPRTTVHAADIEPLAVACASENLAPYNGSVHHGDLYDALRADLCGRVDVVVANAPYVPHDDVALMPPEARLHEPLAALDGGPDGLDVQRRIAAEARRWLAPGGCVVIETSEAQASDTVEVLRAAGFATQVEQDADLDATVVVGSDVEAERS